MPESIRCSVASLHDFDIDLTDYFDLVAGTSSGSILAAYVAARGKGSSAILSDMRIRRRHGTVRPGSMEAMRAVVHEFSRDIFPQRGLLSNITRLFRALYSPAGLQSVLRRSFSEMAVSDSETGLLVTSFDLRRNTACSFIRGAGKDARLYTVHTAARENPRHSASDGALHDEAGAGSGQSPADWVPDLDIAEGTDYRLRDIVLASSSAPTYFPPAEISPLSEGEELRLVDGAVVANNPSLQALTYAPACFSTDSIDNVAILSLGCGNTTPSKRERENPGVGWWLLSGNLINSLQNGTSEYVQAVIDFWLYRNAGLPYGQYIRIQKTARNDKELEILLGEIDAVEYLPDLEQLGEDLADENEEDLKRFVRDFMFAT